MSLKTNVLRLFLFIFSGMIFMSSHFVSAEGLTLYTPYTKVSVTPGQSIDYSIDAINNTAEIQNEEISVTGIPRGWNYSLKSGGMSIGQLAVLPTEKKSISLQVEVPYQVNKGNYRITVMGGKSSSLPLIINVSEKGSSESEITCDQNNMQGNSKSTFTFKAHLKNRTPDKQLYALMADLPRGWNIVFKANYQQVTSVELEANTTKDIDIEVTAANEVSAGTYKIPVRAVTGSTSANLELEVVVTGSYSVELSTPTGLLSTQVTAGEEKKLELVVRNTGSSVLADVEMKASSPANWSVEFDPKKVDKIIPGQSATVFALIKADKKAIPGDYVANIEAKTPETSSKIAFRVSVKTSMLWGWIGVLVIVGALGIVYYLFRKYGRR
ncbi:MAG: NEW3 domain-containing protein [Prolixibacteraceae bacterium]|jgi:uncharacterized membrane protein|nr:NEW3 domain-containing protein [Prolixibacteraceae bacterium]